MAKFAWATDIHLDFLSGQEDKIVAFAESLVKDNPTGVLLTGDISSAPKVIYHLSILERVIQRPIYFVLGNHDYYGGDIESVRKNMRELTNMSQHLKYLSILPYFPLSPSAAVVGHDGWYDAMNGDARASRFVMADWTNIKDFATVSGGHAAAAAGRLNKDEIIALSRKLAFEGVSHVQQSIKSASRYHKNIVVLTHFPPFPQAHVHEGKVGDANAQPWYTSKIMGDMLLDAAKTFPQVNFIVLAGHTHGQISLKVEKNLHVHVGHADYGTPQLASMIEVP